MSSSFGSAFAWLDQVDPELLLDAGGERIGAGEHEVDVDPARILLRLDLACEFGSRRLGEGDARDQVRLRLAVVLDGLLRQRQVAGDIDDVERDGARRQGRLRKARPAEGRNAGSARGATDEGPSGDQGSSCLPPVLCDMAHERPRPVSQLVGLFREAIGKIVGDLVRLVLVEAMGDHEIGEIGAIHPAGHVVPRRIDR